MLIQTNLQVECPRCRGGMRSAVVKTAIWAGERLYAVEDVPAYVCEACGERLYDEDTTNAIRRLTEDGFSRAEARHEILVPVFSLGDRIIE
ncbi:MAG: YgiT-type zinc finger protein [Chloroflexi bacterium]|nr:YgiT-type zinc finger protein [Chloroflexota bacterium]